MNWRTLEPRTLPRTFLVRAAPLTLTCGCAGVLQFTPRRLGIYFPASYSTHMENLIDGEILVFASARDTRRTISWVLLVLEHFETRSR